jgi:hypothetical protein
MGKNRLSRREALASLLALPALRAARVGGAPAATVPTLDLGELAESFRRCAHRDALDVAVKAIRNGADRQAILGAIFLAGILDLRPRHVGGKLHAVLMVESTFQLAEAADRQSAWLLALWNLDDFKRSQEIARAEGEWALPKRPQAAFPSEESARREFLAAMDAWDEERADRALVGLLPHHDLASLFEVLWPLAARSYVNIGHKMIFAAQTERVLARIGWPHAEPALRSLVYGLLYRPSGTETEAFERSRELAGTLPETTTPGPPDPARAGALLKELRENDSRSAQARVAGVLKEGTSAATVWDALRVWASELFARRRASQPADDRAALLPVHAVTVTNALGYAWRTTRSETTRRLLILQASGWLPLLRDDLARIVGLGPAVPAGDEPRGDAGGAPARLEGLLEDPSPATVRAHLRDPQRWPAYRSALVEHLARKGVEPHQHKYAAVVFEESGLVHRQWAPYVLAAAVPYLPGRRQADTEIAERSREALARAGV